jgi:hypothetical protein
MRAPVASLLALLVVLGAGCGADTPPESGTRTTATAAEQGPTKQEPTGRDRAVKFAECMRAHGVGDFPDPDASGDFPDFGVSVSPAVWSRAVAGCKALQPPGTLSSERTPKQQSTALRFAQCMRDHGVKDFPDPRNGDPLIDTTKIPSLGNRSPRTDPVFRPAVDACGAALRAALRDR